MRARALTILAAALLAAGVGAARADVLQRHGIRINFQGSLSPKRLPRHGLAPVAVDLSARISGTHGSSPPPLRRIELAINSHGRLDPTSLPKCTMRKLQPTTDADALAACGASLIGEGTFSAKVGFTGQAPFPAAGKLLAFNGSYHGHPAVLAHVFGTKPVPTSYTLPFLIEPSHGTFGTVLSATVEDVTGSDGYITGLSLRLGRTSVKGGAGRGYVSAGCPAPEGVPEVVFPFARATFAFEGGAVLRSTVVRSCRARG
ncbi:MAG TPA: hypothetical protein VMF55_13845 [Solirubrobacterales bacterium]|nr:hypothetical protein [Solirubrobacterales bacterium]